MTRAEIVKPYVEKVLKESFGSDQLAVNERGEWPVRQGSAVFLVRLLPTDPPLVQVYSPVLQKVQRTDKLLQEINDINAQIHFARMFWVQDLVVLSTELMADTLDGSELNNAMAGIALMADHYDTQLKGAHGGETAIPEEGSGKEPPGYI